MTYAIPVIRTVVREHEWRIRMLERQLVELKKNPPFRQEPKFNKHPWPWRKHFVRDSVVEMRRGRKSI